MESMKKKANELVEDLQGLQEDLKVLLSEDLGFDLKRKLREIDKKTGQAVRKARGVVFRAAESEGAVDVERQPELKREKTSWGPHNNIEESHESYGVVEISKPSGHRRLVGSMVDSLPQCVEIRVKRACRSIDPRLHTERWEGKERLLTIRLSVYQWAEMMSNMQGQPVPCTIAQVFGVSMDEVPEEARTPLEEIGHQARKEFVEGGKEEESHQPRGGGGGQ